jgi:hypothetical protein
MRVRVLEAELLAQTDVPNGASANVEALLAGCAKRIGTPTFFPDRASIRVTVPNPTRPTKR